MDCDQCEVLRRVAEDLEVNYAKARGRFTELSEHAEANAFNRARGWVNEARLDYEVARIEYEQHRRAHTP